MSRLGNFSRMSRVCRVVTCCWNTMLDAGNMTLVPCRWIELIAVSKATSESFNVTAEELGLEDGLAGDLNWSETSQKY